MHTEERAPERDPVRFSLDVRSDEGWAAILNSGHWYSMDGTTPYRSWATDTQHARCLEVPIDLRLPLALGLLCVVLAASCLVGVWLLVAAARVGMRERCS